MLTSYEATYIYAYKTITNKGRIQLFNFYVMYKYYKKFNKSYKNKNK